jgi:hypothetical protein
MLEVVMRFESGLERLNPAAQSEWKQFAVRRYVLCGDRAIRVEQTLGGRACFVLQLFLIYYPYH